MKRLALAVMVVVVGGAAWAQEKSCSQVVSENAKYPAQLKATLTAVADVHQQHAQWVGTSTREAKAESALMMKISEAMRDTAKDAEKIATRMQSASTLKDTQHDMQNMPTALIMAMERARDEQRKFGNLLLEGAKEMDKQLSSMRGMGGSGVGGSGEAGTDMSTPEVPMDNTMPPGEMPSDPMPPQKK